MASIAEALVWGCVVFGALILQRFKVKITLGST